MAKTLFLLKVLIFLLHQKPFQNFIFSVEETTENLTGEQQELCISREFKNYCRKFVQN